MRKQREPLFLNQFIRFGFISTFATQIKNKPKSV